MKNLVINIWNETNTIGRIMLVVVEAIVIGVGVSTLVYMAQRGL